MLKNIDKDNMEKYFNLIENLTGLSLSESNSREIENHIINRIKLLNMSFNDYYYYLKNNQIELQLLFNASTINETYFFREEKQFIILGNKIFPELYKNNREIKILSATCSTGEEAVSIALLLKKLYASDVTFKYTIYAADINSQSIENFKKGEYSKNSFRKDGNSYKYLFDLYGSINNEIWKLDDKILNEIKIFNINILSNDLNLLPNDFDLILFRNTLIYMKKSYRDKIIKLLENKLKTGGYLFIGISEVPFIKSENLKIEEESQIYYFMKSNKKNE